MGEWCTAVGSVKRRRSARTASRAKAKGSKNLDTEYSDSIGSLLEEENRKLRVNADAGLLKAID